MDAEALYHAGCPGEELRAEPRPGLAYAVGSASHPRSYTELMTVTVDLPEDALARLRAEAQRRGVSIDVVIAELTAALPPESSPGTRTGLSFVGLGSSNSGRYARDADELLADGFGHS
jgi:hypothetical protein